MNPVADRTREHTREYLFRVAVISSAGAALQLTVSILLNGAFTVLGLFTSVVVGLYVPARSVADLFRAYEVMLVMALLLCVPAVLLIGDAASWVALGMAVVMAVTTRLALSWRVRRSAPEGVELRTTDGREIPLDVRPFTCHRSNRLHYAIFAAQNEPVKISDGDMSGTMLVIDEMGPGCLLVATFYDEPDGSIWLPGTPPGLHLATALQSTKGAFRPV